MKKLSFVIVCLSIYVISYGQTTFKFPSGLNTGAELVEKTIESTFILLYQDYALENKDGQRFGRGGGSCFNSIEYIGIATNEGVLFFDDIMQPWMSDKEFADYKDAYKPFLISTSVSLLETEYKEDIPIKDSIYKNVENKYYILEDSTYSRGLIIDKTDSISRNGWFVWITLDHKASKKLSLNIYKRELPEEDINGKITVKEPNLGNNILGALYITPLISGPGVLQFKLEAVISKDKDAQNWIITPVATCNKKNICQKSLTPLENIENEA